MPVSTVKVILFCVYASLGLRSSDASIVPKNASVSAVFVFGDSVVDQGNNNYIITLGKVNFPPYGMDFMGGKPTGRYSNGKTLSDLFAEAFGVKEYLPASLDPSLEDKDLQTGVSFASGGSGFDPLTNNISSGISMSDQLNMFKQHIGKLKKNIEEEVVDTIISNSVAVIVAGNNDILLSLPARRLQYDDTSYANMIANLALNFTQEIYALGVRRIIVFSALPLGCTPTVRTLSGGLQRSCADDENKSVQLLNNFLKQKLQVWGTSNPQSRVAFIDYYKYMMTVINNPHTYGFDVVDRGCCGTGLVEGIFLCNKLTAPTCPDRSKFFFWDGFHLTEKGNDIVLEYILQDLVNTLF